MCTDCSSHRIHDCVFLRISPAAGIMITGYQHQNPCEPIGLGSIQGRCECWIQPDEKFRSSSGRSKETNGDVDGFYGSFERANYRWMNERRAELSRMTSLICEY